MKKKYSKIFKKYWESFFKELILIVLGVLLGLQADSWIKNYYQNKQELQLLSEMYYNLNSNSEEIRKTLTREEEFYGYTLDIIKAFNEKRYDSLNLNKKFKWLVHLDNIELQSSSYSTLKSIGLSLISNDGLRKEVVNMFEVKYPSYINKAYKSSQKQLEVYGFESIRNQFSWDLKTGNYIPNNYKTLFENKEFYNTITLIAEWKKWRVDLKKTIKSETDKLMDMIEEELIKREYELIK